MNFLEQPVNLCAVDPKSFLLPPIQPLSKSTAGKENWRSKDFKAARLIAQSLPCAPCSQSSSKLQTQFFIAHSLQRDLPPPKKRKVVPLDNTHRSLAELNLEKGINIDADLQQKIISRVFWYLPINVLPKMMLVSKTAQKIAGGYFCGHEPFGTLRGLPNEIILNILGMADLQDLLAIRSTCRAGYVFASDKTTKLSKLQGNAKLVCEKLRGMIEAKSTPGLFCAALGVDIEGRPVYDAIELLQTNAKNDTSRRRYKMTFHVTCQPPLAPMVSQAEISLQKEDILRRRWVAIEGSVLPPQVRYLARLIHRRLQNMAAGAFKMAALQQTDILMEHHEWFRRMSDTRSFPTRHLLDIPRGLIHPSVSQADHPRSGH